MSGLDRLHAPKLTHNILLMVWTSTLICWSSPTEFQLSGTIYVDCTFFRLCWKQLSNSCAKKYWRVVFWNNVLFLLSLSQLSDSFLLNLSYMLIFAFNFSFPFWEPYLEYTFFSQLQRYFGFPVFPVIYSAHDQDCYSSQIDRKYHAWSSSQKLQLSLSGLPRL